MPTLIVQAIGTFLTLEMNDLLFEGQNIFFICRQLLLNELRERIVQDGFAFTYLDRLSHAVIQLVLKVLGGFSWDCVYKAIENKSFNGIILEK